MRRPKVLPSNTEVEGEIRPQFPVVLEVESHLVRPVAAIELGQATRGRIDRRLSEGETAKRRLTEEHQIRLVSKGSISQQLLHAVRQEESVFGRLESGSVECSPV